MSIEPQSILNQCLLLCAEEDTEKIDAMINTIKQSSYHKQLSIPEQIIVEITKFASGTWAKCNNKECGKEISMTKGGILFNYH